MELESIQQQQIKDLEATVNNWRESWRHMNARIEGQQALLKECLEYLENHGCVGSGGLIKKLVEALE